MPVELQCIACEGKGCDDCGTSGFLTLTKCPNRELTSEVIDLVEFSDLYATGLPPIAGGALDQTKSFLDAHRQLSNDQHTIKRALGIL